MWSESVTLDPMTRIEGWVVSSLTVKSRSSRWDSASGSGTVPAGRIQSHWCPEEKPSGS